MPVTVSGTSITFNNGTTQSTAAIAPASTDYGGVGSYVVAYYGVTSTTSIHFFSSILANGTTVAGSSLRVSSLGTANQVQNAGIFNSGTTSFVRSGSTPFPTANTTTLSGTWRLMLGGVWTNFRDNGCNDLVWFWYPLLWVRIS